MKRNNLEIVRLAIVCMVSLGCGCTYGSYAYAADSDRGASLPAEIQSKAKIGGDGTQQGQIPECKHDPNSSLRCAGTPVPEPGDVEEFWHRLIALISPVRGYVAPEDVEREFGIRFTKVSTQPDGHQVSRYQGGKPMPLSIQLDSYAPNHDLQKWQRDQGEFSAARSTLNLSEGNFGCISVLNAEKQLSDAGFVMQGSIIYKFGNFGRSITTFGDPNRPTTITLYYGQAAIAEPCVLSIKIDAYKQ